MYTAEDGIRVLVRARGLGNVYKRQIVDGKEARVTVRFKKEISDYILRKDKWHTSEKRTILPDGDVELSFTVAGVDEIKRWIYSWLPHAEVIKPKWFRQQVKKELAVSAATHS